MHGITVRGVEERLYRALKKEAKRRGVSVNRLILVLLQEALGLAMADELPGVEFNDLDHLAGTSSAAEAEEFERQLGEQRRIDEKLW